MTLSAKPTWEAKKPLKNRNLQPNTAEDRMILGGVLRFGEICCILEL
jgi:hypothetical protein